MNEAQKKKFQKTSKEALERVKAFDNGGTMPCEYHGCTCPVRRQIAVTSFSTIVTADYDIEYTCLEGAQDFAKRQNVVLRSF